MFLTGPGVVKEVTGEDVDAGALGGPKVHDRNGVCQLVADGRATPRWLVRDLLDYLPQHAGERAPVRRAGRAARARPGAPCPTSARSVYDVRDVVARVVDGGRLLELNAALGAQRGDRLRPHRRPRVGIVANQPQLPRRRARRRRGREGRALRAHLRRLRPPARRARRHARLPARHRPGAGAASSATAPSSSTRSPRPPCRGHRRAAQGLRRRVHRDEQPRAGRGPRARLAAGAARRHGCQAGRDLVHRRDDRRRRRPAAARERFAEAYATST